MPEAEPAIATDAGPPSFSVVCPVCETVKFFDFDEMKEADCGNWWSVATPYRFDHCADCEAFVDYGAVSYQMHPPRRDLEKERQDHERMLSRFSEAEREHTRRHFDAVKTQAPEGCDTGRKVPAVKDHDCMYDAYDSDY